MKEYTLRNKGEITRRLVEMEDDPILKEYFYPKLAEHGREKLTAGHIHLMLVLTLPLAALKYRKRMKKDMPVSVIQNLSLERIVNALVEDAGAAAEVSLHEASWQKETNTVH